MFFRELGVPIKEIQQALSRPDTNLMDLLENHRQRLQQNINRVEKLIDTIDQTIATLKGERTMKDKEYFASFDESQYEAEAQQRWGSTTQYRESQRKWSSYTKSQKDAIKAEGGQLAIRMVTESQSAKPDDQDVQTAVGEYFNYLKHLFLQL